MKLSFSPLIVVLASSVALPELANASDTRATYFPAPMIQVVATFNGEVYIGGEISPPSNLPALPALAGGAQEAPVSINSEIFVSRLSSDLSTVLQTTYYGGTGSEFLHGIVVTEDAVFIAGFSSSPTLPGSESGAQPAQAGVSDGFVARLSRDLRVIERSTFFGGSEYDEPLAMILVEGDALLIAGVTMSEDLPWSEGGAQPKLAGDVDAFLARLDLDLTTVNSTYLGGSRRDEATAIAVHKDAIFVAGFTLSEDLPAVAGGAQETYSAVGPLCSGDGFVARLDSHLNAILQSTYLGGTCSDYAKALASTDKGIYFLGITYSADFPFTAGGAAPQLQGDVGTVVVRLAESLTSVLQATHLPGHSVDIFAAPDAIYVAGSAVAGLPLTGGAVQQFHAGGGDGFVAALALDLEDFFQSTYFGGQGWDAGRVFGAEIGATGKLEHWFLAGRTLSNDLSHTAQGAQPALSFPIGGFVVRLPTSLRE